MIDVRVRVDDRIHGRAERIESLVDALEVAAGIDDDRALGLRVDEERAVAAERTCGESFDDHAG